MFNCQKEGINYEPEKTKLHVFRLFIFFKEAHTARSEPVRERKIMICLSHILDFSSWGKKGAAGSSTKTNSLLEKT